MGSSQRASPKPPDECQPPDLSLERSPQAPGAQRLGEVRYRSATVAAEVTTVVTLAQTGLLPSAAPDVSIKPRQASTMEQPLGRSVVLTPTPNRAPPSLAPDAPSPGLQTDETPRSPCSLGCWIRVVPTD